MIGAPVIKMGNSESSESKGGDLKTRSGVAKLPMPDDVELEKKFTKVLASMDLPPDKAKLLKQYDNEKKWDIICDQERVHAKEAPAHYLNKLRTYLDPKASRSSKKRKTLGDSSSTQVLRNLEISLRTNHIEWVREFLNEDNRGLDVLIDYLSFRQIFLRHEYIVSKALREEDCLDGSGSQPNLNNGHFIANSLMNAGDSNKHPGKKSGDLGSEKWANNSVTGANNVSVGKTGVDFPKLRRASKHSQKLKMGEAKDDIHVCIMCLRAIMNNKYGFNMVIEHTQAINCIALSLNHKSLRTKALVLELLAAICLVRGGHRIILNAFDNFKEVCTETKRFGTLMEYFMNQDTFSIDFMVACMQFINIVVHSVEDMNYRVHLQYEFTQLGLDDYLEKLRYSESEELQIQISAYFDNVFDVAALMEDSETKSAALEKVSELDEQLSHAHDRLLEMENESMAKIVELETQIQQIASERDDLMNVHAVMNDEMNTLRRAVNEKEEESRNRQSLLENKIQELEVLHKTLPRSSGDGAPATASICPSIVAPAPPPPPPPAPPPPPIMGRGPVPPPPPGMMQAPGDAMTIKRRIQPKYKLPTLNWIALKPNQVKGTVFNDLDDDKLFHVIDFNAFEEQFKIGHVGPTLDNGDGKTGGSYPDGLQSYGSKRFRRPEMVTLLEHNRLRNLAIQRRKVEMSLEAVVRCINSLDLKTLTLENVEMLLRMVPTEQEVKLYKEFERERKPVHSLTEEDQFLFNLCKVERLAQKLNIMSYMGNYFENIQLITPQIHAIIAASRSLKSSKKIRRMLEIILAFGNYLNSSKRGPAYGFKLQSLDVLLDTKSTDKRISLLHYIVDTVNRKFPDLSNFDLELRFVEKAGQVSLENIMTDIHELEKGMDLCKKECELRMSFKDNCVVLKEFLFSSEDKLKKLQLDTKTAQDAYSDVVEFFGESSRTLAANIFFMLFLRFIKAFKQAELDNEARRRQEVIAAREAAGVTITAPSDKKAREDSKKMQQDAVINELMNKTRLVKEKKLLKQDEVYNGALEDILLGLKNEPYRRADAVRRSQRRRQENNRLSRNMDEIDV